MVKIYFLANRQIHSRREKKKSTYFHYFYHKTGALEHEFCDKSAQPSGNGLEEAQRACADATSQVPMWFLGQDEGIPPIPTAGNVSQSAAVPCHGHRSYPAGCTAARNANRVCCAYIQLWKGPICTSLAILHIRRKADSRVLSKLFI